MKSVTDLTEEEMAELAEKHGETVRKIRVVAEELADEIEDSIKKGTDSISEAHLTIVIGMIASVLIAKAALKKKPQLSLKDAEKVFDAFGFAIAADAHRQYKTLLQN